MNAKLLLAIALFWMYSLTEVRAQTTSGGGTSAEYKVGQVWNYKTAPGAEESRLVILNVESQGKKGNLVHIRIENIPTPNCAGFHLTTAIEHLAVPEKILRKSTTDLVKDQMDLPKDYFEAYKQWQNDRHKQVIKRPLAEIALPGGCPIIVNFGQTA